MIVLYGIFIINIIVIYLIFISIIVMILLLLIIIILLLNINSKYLASENDNTGPALAFLSPPLPSLPVGNHV